MICNLIMVIDGRMMRVIGTSIWLVLQDVLCDSVCQAFCNVLQNNIHAGMFYRAWIISACVHVRFFFIIIIVNKTKH